jgi:hypothetical protein
MSSERPLTARERDVLDFLLSVKGPGVAELRGQATHATARPWTCGCASVDLMVDRTTSSPTTLRARPAVEAETLDRESLDGVFDLLLWVSDDGWLDAIEIVDYLERHEDSPDELPDPSLFGPPRLRKPNAFQTDPLQG